MKLDLRLTMVASLVRPGKPIADIGTDHAYVPVYLIKNGIIPSAYACDVKVGPLDNAKKTIEEFELEDKITPILSDGLISVPHDVNDFVIAGMGGELIAKILSDSPWVKEEGNHFVLQPQTHAEDLRHYLLSEGYEILKEDVVKDKRHLYIAMEVSYTGKVVAHTESDYYLGKLPKSSSIYKKDYIEYMISRLDVQYKATRKEDIKALIDSLKEALS
ncbi:MAG: SAM-dependent methyltransferase [Oscillospiraceae bacterium]|nr:SAM-dependent methyltransferase [Candidatus Limimonas egerieequi]